MICTAHKRKPAQPFGFRGSRSRCANEAIARVTSYSTAGYRMAQFVVCAEHLDGGTIGMQTPTGWTWHIESLITVSP